MTEPGGGNEVAGSIGRRRFLGYVLAAPTLVTAAELGVANAAGTAAAEPVAAPGSPTCST